MNSLLRHSFVVGAVVGLIVIALIVGALRPKHASGAGTAPPTEVMVAQVEQKDVDLYSEWIGTLAGEVNANVQAQVTGYLLRRNYQEGSFVRKGQLLFEIDPRPFQAALDQAEGQLAQATAQLANAEAAVETAKLNLGFTKISSPVDGIADVARAQVGDLVSSSSGTLTTVSALDPIRDYFTVSEQDYLQLKKQFSGSDKQRWKLELILADASIYPHEGVFYFAGRAVDQNTGAIQMAALFPNPGNLLRPGQYGKVRAVVRTQKGALLVPQAAVSDLQGSYQVNVVGGDDKISIRSVKVGDRVGSTMWIIQDGLKPGERVVAQGQQTLRP